MPMDDLLATQKKLAHEAADLEKLKDDPEALMKKAGELAKKVKDFESAALKFAAQFQPVGGPEERVVLTPDQRERLAESTGVAMEVLVVRDPDGAFAKAMPTARKEIIERLAARQAGEVATKKAKAEAVEKLLKDLRKIEAPGMDEIIRAIEDDPSLEKLQEKLEEIAKETKEKTGQGA